MDSLCRGSVERWGEATWSAARRGGERSRKGGIARARYTEIYYVDKKRRGPFLQPSDSSKRRPSGGVEKFSSKTLFHRWKRTLEISLTITLFRSVWTRVLRTRFSGHDGFFTFISPRSSRIRFFWFPKLLAVLNKILISTPLLPPFRPPT